MAEQSIDQIERLQLVLRAQADPDFFLDSPYFMGEMAGKAYPKQREIFTSFYKPSHKELIVAGGMGGGKSFLGSCFIARDAFDVLTREDPAKDYKLSPHSLITLWAIAKSVDQSSDTIFGEVRNRMTAPFFQEYGAKISEYDIQFKKHPDVQIMAAGAISAGSIMGRNAKSVVFDEITSYDETQSQRGARQFYSRLRKSTNRFGEDGHVYVISMVWHANDIVSDLIRDAKAKNSPDTLWYEVTTWEMNPNKPFNSSEMQNELNRDPLTFWRDYGVRPFNSLESFYPDDTIINVNPNRINLLADSWNIWKATPDWRAIKEYNYILSTDPGRRNDTFGIALLHKEGKQTIVDGLLRLRPAPKKVELDPMEVRDFLLWICKTFPISVFATDQAALYFADLESRVQQLGVRVINHPNVKEDHDKVKRAWFDKTLELCSFEGIQEEFKQLTIINSQKIGTPKGAIIDMVDAVTRGFWASNEYLSVGNTAFHLLSVIK